MKLFTAPGTCGLACHIALEEAGIPYEIVTLDLRNNEQKSLGYLAVNPKARVPALMIDDETVVTEAPAILTYIALTYPTLFIQPIEERLLFTRLIAFNNYLTSTVHVAHAHRYRGKRWADNPASLDDMQRKVPETMAECFDVIERNLFLGPWVLGRRFSVADPYLLTMTRWLESDGVEVSRFKKIDAHRNRMMERGAVQRVLASIS
uniref:Glutathione S-transferase, putative n=1 Tax=Rhizobium rhizogenes TaxID=359 RepID=A0A7S4ZSN5_RHIRH|nr:glutathione S-transferase N-terminal domain-containing protein [Rhizobium rhizogenes]QCL09183.1 putative glutathione S-transferase [Rhizobium rhizogenes]QCL09816.1 glutathione S-transferase, putative [Rhizobium rhizogenes]